MSRIIIITVPPPPPPGFVSSMPAGSVEVPPFEVRCQDEELSYTEQAAVLREAADYLDSLQSAAGTADEAE